MRKKNHTIDYLILFFLLLTCLGGFAVSITTLFILPYFVSEYSVIKSYDSLERIDGLTIATADPQPDIMYAYNSPVVVPIVIQKPNIKNDHLVKLVISENNKLIKEIECIPADLSQEKMICNASFPYTYAPNSKMEVRAVLELFDGKRFVSNKIPLTYDWANYEKGFRNISSSLLIIIILGFLLLILPLSAMMYHLTTLEKHHAIYKGEYTLQSLLQPFRYVKTKEQFFQAFISSPLFWFIEFIGAFLLIIYYALSADVFKSDTSLVAFLISGGFAFFVPFLWVAVWWLADYKEREPLRIIISLFLWGAFCCIISIGINTIAEAFFVVLGLSLISSMIFPPLVEEFFKGTGLAIFSLHHDYSSIGDGLVYGFTIGMGFAFMENWLYLLDNPMGADITMWASLFFLRAVLFSAMHGVYTAVTGALIGYLKTIGKPQILLFGFTLIPAIFLHSIHNSVDILSAIFGDIGVLAYCCVVGPLFDYGGLFVIAVLMLAWLNLSSKSRKNKSI
ncbi:MAG: PrsW family intramembrane metalloprotease [Candidatus Bilamarchaeaceae archaeon]